MPSLTTHIQQAELNEEAALFNQDSFPHVAIIMCFYAALHYVEAYAAWHNDNIYELYSDPVEIDAGCSPVSSKGATQQKRLTQHQRYQSYVDDIATDNGWDDLPVIYEQLRKASEKARYLKGIKDKNKTSGRHFKLGADFYIAKLQLLKASLQISFIKASIEGA